MKNIRVGLCVISAVILIFSIALYVQGSDKSVFVSLLGASIGFTSAGIGLKNQLKRKTDD